MWAGRTKPGRETEVYFPTHHEPEHTDRTGLWVDDDAETEAGDGAEGDSEPVDRPEGDGDSEDATP